MPGDIFLTRGSSLLSRAIRFCTRSIGEGRSRVNHVGFITTGGALGDADCIEALATVTEHALWEMYADGTEVAIYRVRKWSGKDRARCVELARGYEGRTYGYVALGAHLLDWVLQGAYVFRRLTSSEAYPICSWLVGHVCGKLGCELSAVPGAESPDDIWDRVRERGEDFELIKPLGPLSA
jgi:hypothetical protein